MQTNAPRPFLCIFSKLREADYFTSICISFPQWGQVTEVFRISSSSLTRVETDTPIIFAISWSLSKVGLPFTIDDTEGWEMPFSPFLFFISAANCSSVQPLSFITFLMFIDCILYFSPTKVMIFLFTSKKKGKNINYILYLVKGIKI